MRLLALIFGIVFLPKVYTLKCHECVPGMTGTCEDKQKECPSNQKCGAMRLTSYVGGNKLVDINSKGCSSAEECVEASANFGVIRTAIANKCCSSPLCNANPAPEPSKSTPNGKKCFYCGAMTGEGQDCSRTLDCEGSEDYCISSKMTVAETKVTMKGCASKLLCSGNSTAEISQVTGGEISCCQGNFCNSASSTSAGLLLLVAPLLSLMALF
ncbi:urokinase plasminogen activator surface receptor-like [Centropristis striata]|uniref:urokinase plasminogen activator surface receptor-like n=1 Tax=Centropristis striata TaxID=184440 RepID=UPI0027DEF358|nr:urokinase plasminogen activator surface receptor-like [Centropristis striata]